MWHKELKLRLERDAMMCSQFVANHKQTGPKLCSKIQEHRNVYLSLGHEGAQQALQTQTPTKQSHLISCRSPF